MARLVFINRFFHPDQSATSQILSDLAFALAAEGHEVHVISGRKLYGKPGDPLPESETARGVSIHRVGSTKPASAGLAGRLREYLGFYFAAAIETRRQAKAGSIIVTKTDPPLFSIVTAVVTTGRRVARVNWLQDIYPEVAARLGVRFVAGLPGRALARLRDWSLRKAVANIALGERMAEFLAERGVPHAKIRTIPNWVDDEAIRPIAPEASAMRREWGLGDRFVVGYSGNLGRAHEYETLVGAATLLRDRNDIVFLFIGGGFGHDGLKAELRTRGLEGLFQFKPWQDQSRLAESLSVADAHWVSLRPEMEGLIVPSKFLGIAAAGRPTLAVTETDGEIARLARKHQCGVVVEPGDSAGLAAAIEDLARDAATRERQGVNARRMLDAEFSREHALRRWRELLPEIEASQKKSGA